MMELRRKKWGLVLEGLWLANRRLVPKESAQRVMDEYFAAEELLLRELHPELMQ